MKRETTATVSGGTRILPSLACALAASARAEAMVSSRLTNVDLASPLKTMNRHGLSLPWSGARAAKVRIVVSSKSLGAGAVKVIAEADRRRAKNASVSGERLIGRESPNDGEGSGAGGKITAFSPLDAREISDRGSFSQFPRQVPRELPGDAPRACAAQRGPLQGAAVKVRDLQSETGRIGVDRG